MGHLTAREADNVGRAWPAVHAVRGEHAHDFATAVAAIMESKSDVRDHLNTLFLLVLLGGVATADAQVQPQVAQRYFEEATKLSFARSNLRYPLSRSRTESRFRGRCAPLLPTENKARKMVQHVNNVQMANMKTNVTLKLDADLLREARVVAAEEGRSISALLADRLEAIVRERKAFDKARRRALARLREGLDLQWTRPKSRDELHER
jgi:hypothetical protein